MEHLGIFEIFGDVEIKGTSYIFNASLTEYPLYLDISYPVKAKIMRHCVAHDQIDEPTKKFHARYHWTRRGFVIIDCICDWIK